MKIDKIAKKIYPEDVFKYHIMPVVKNSLLLAKKLKANKKIVEAAAYLHDIARATAKNKKQKRAHHILGSKQTKTILTKLGYDKEFISQVEHCVLTHRGIKDYKPRTLEAKIINCADAMAHFDTFFDLFGVFLKKRSFEETVIVLEKKMKRDWDEKLILPEAKKLVKDKYKSIMLLLKSMKEYI